MMLIATLSPLRDYKKLNYFLEWDSGAETVSAATDQQIPNE